MSDTITFTINDVEVKARKGQTVLDAAEAAGIYIPRLCHMKGLIPASSCRVCTVLINGRPCASCTQPAADGAIVQNDTPELNEWRKRIIEMLFVEGNHYCMFCEKSGNCELQAMGYRLGMMEPRYPYLFPARAVDASHPEVLIDHNRCIFCGRCGRAARQLDRKIVFGMLGRGRETRLGVDGERLADTSLEVTDRAAEVCPVGAIIKKRVGFAAPIGKRLYDQKPIGSDIEEARK